jgi:ATP-dependent RNA helicase DeaD
MFFSATITPRVQMLARRFLTDPKNITIAAATESAAEIEHLYCRAGAGVAAKAAALCTVIESQNPRSAIVFCNTKSDTELLEAFLRRRNFNARRINSDLSQNERDAIMKSIHAGELRILIATDVAARGIDIEELDLVINYTIHDRHETYVHRTGRTGRAGRSGKAVLIVGPSDYPAFCNLRKLLPNIDFKEIPLPAGQ